MATLSGVRVNLFNENFLNETEQDANSVLTELDKGLRSSKIGIQCEAIVRFPRLFEKYPFPILINSSFLKLAEFFLNGSNLLRFWVLRVCQQSENHLDKILNVENFVKRIFMVIHSNDPVARALTLRTLGAVSRLIPEKQQVHHAIRRALDSHDAVEQEAAINASGHFAAQSRSFAISMCSKISDMIESLLIPVPIKLQLIPVLRHMHHDANTAAMVKKVCFELLPKYPAQGFVVSILDTLTWLSARTLTGVSDQVDLLLDCLKDPRRPVRSQVLQSLTVLADSDCASAWPKTAIGTLLIKAKECDEAREQLAFLRIISKLSDNALMCHTLLNDQLEPMIKLSLDALCLYDFTTASEGMAILAALIVYADEDPKLAEAMDRILFVVNLHMEGLVFCTIHELGCTKDLQKLLCAGVRIASVDRDFGVWLVGWLTDLFSDDVDYRAESLELMFDALGALGALFQVRFFSLESTETSGENPQPMEIDEPSTSAAAAAAAAASAAANAAAASANVTGGVPAATSAGNATADPDSDTQTTDASVSKLLIAPTIEELLEKSRELERQNPVVATLSLLLKKLNEIMDAGLKPEQCHSVEILGAVFFQSMLSCFPPLEIVQCFDRICKCTTRWTQYRLVRSACRYGQHYMAQHLLTKISPNTVADKLNFFLTGVSQMCQAEVILNFGVEYSYMQANYKQCESKATKDIWDPPLPEPQEKPLMQRLECAINLYWQAFASMRASSSSAHPHTFQSEIIKLRAQLLQTLHFGVTIKKAHIMIPPPAIANTLAQNSRDYLQKFGHITCQLRKFFKALKGCQEAYARLYKSAFDADPVTLEYLEIAEYQCALFAHIIETICYVTPSDPPLPPQTGRNPETCFYAKSCRRMEELVELLPKETNANKSVNHQHLHVIMGEIETIIRMPFCLPRYFFQSLQSTQIKLSISPTPRNPGEPVNIQPGSNLVIKVEGVIQHYGRKRSLYRSVDQVQLNLNSQQVAAPRAGTSAAANAAANAEAQKSNAPESITLTQTVKPHRDFLSGSFLLPISSGGQWQVTLETYVIDENGISWYTGPKNSMLVRVLEDPAKASSSSQAGQTRRF